MTTFQDDVSVHKMSSEDIKLLPKRVRNDLKGAIDTVLIASHSLDEAEVVAKVARTAASIIRTRHVAMAENRIKALVDFYLEGQPLAQIDEDLERDNAQLRAQYLQHVPCLSAAEIRDQQDTTPPRNTSEPASRWKRERKVFAVPLGNSDRFPAFQFNHGKPLPIISKILAALPEDMTPWQIALWFASGNGWLDDACPQDSLANVSAVLDAAQRLNDPVVG